MLINQARKKRKQKRKAENTDDFDKIVKKYKTKMNKKLRNIY